jgi:diadenosine tetraphosphatase ApaH/serine/threonine PP2A family protein phosphatase
MGGAYGNVPALTACIAHAQKACDKFAFLGDSTGFCGHSDAIIALLRSHFAVFVAGNHEKQAVAGSMDCGCDYSSAEDEQLGCLAHQHAMRSLSASSREWLSSWPDLALVQTRAGLLLVCHGSPRRTSEFLYDSVLDEERVYEWLDEFEARVMVCTHTGLPWTRKFADGRFAVNCGVVGKPDDDADAAVHYAAISCSSDGFDVRVERVDYDHNSWADQLESEGVADVFIEPLRTGLWTCGVASLPRYERNLHDERAALAKVAT